MTRCSVAGLFSAFLLIQRVIAAGQPFANPTTDLRLLEPLDGSSSYTITAKPGLQNFFEYFNMAWPWVLGIAAGIGVMQAVMGGVDIMISGSDSGKRETGKSKILWALAGLIMVGLAGTILRTLNPNFYV